MEKNNKNWLQKLVRFEPLQIMQVASILWVVLLTLFVFTTTKCAWMWDIPFYRIDLQYFSCRTTNELGDFLAGGFAPLAFLWLAGAVFIQARELAEQRKSLDAQLEELELTRNEMKQQRDVLQAQANEAKASTAFISEQTDILKREQLLREQVSADAEIEELLLNIIEWRNDYEEVEFIFRTLKFENEYKNPNLLRQIKDRKIEYTFGPFAQWKSFKLSVFTKRKDSENEDLLKNFAPFENKIEDLFSKTNFDFIINNSDIKIGYYSHDKNKFIDFDLLPLKVAMKRINKLTLKASEKQIVRLNRLRIIDQYQAWLILITKLDIYILKKKYEHKKSIFGED